VNNGSRTVVICDTDGKKVPICVLQQGLHENHPLDVLFSEPAEFELKGISVSEVTLIGYLQPPPSFSPEPMLDEDELRAMDDALDEEDEELNQKRFPRGLKKGQRIEEDEEQDRGDEKSQEKTQNTNRPPAKKRKLDEKEGDESKQSEKETRGGDGDDVGDQGKKSQDGAVTLKNGISYKDMKQGTGKPIKNGQTLRVYYVGQLEDKSIFDKSISGDGFEFKFGSNDIIQGWNLGMKGMKVGGKRRIVIPPKFAYGAEGQGQKIPPNATLTFTVELRDAQ
jgi:FK506-binding nuclear protein